jgi:hypothetical protein
MSQEDPGPSAQGLTRDQKKIMMVSRVSAYDTGINKTTLVLHIAMSYKLKSWTSTIESSLFQITLLQNVFNRYGNKN